MSQYQTKDSGRREDFSTGCRRDIRAHKGRYDLLPPYPLHRLAQLYERGAVKYGDRNWEKGMPVSRCLDSAARHLFQLLAGQDDEDHAAAVVFNLFCVMEYEHRIDQGRLPADLDDRRQRDRDATGAPTSPVAERVAEDELLEARG